MIGIGPHHKSPQERKTDLIQMAKLTLSLAEKNSPYVAVTTYTDFKITKMSMHDHNGKEIFSLSMMKSSREGR